LKPTCGARVLRAALSAREATVAIGSVAMIAKTEGIGQDLPAGAMGIAAAVATGLPPAQVNAAPVSDLVFETLAVRKEGAVLFADIAAPPMNLLGPALVRDLVSLIQQAEADSAIRLLVFRSADRDYFISHVDLTQIKEYREEAAKLTGEPSIALLFRHLSASRLVTIAQIEGRVRAAGSEFVLACDMRFAARETAIFSQPEPAFGLVPGGGGAQHLVRLMGRARALEVMLSAQDYDADLAERYGWINRALPAKTLGDFVSSLAHRIAKFPAAGAAAVKERVNAIALAPVEDFRRDSDLFGEGSRNPEAQGRFQAAFKRGFQTRAAEMDLARLLGDLD
jgi:enoyl-CoA hydratase/carnithine racemase